MMAQRTRDYSIIGEEAATAQARGLAAAEWYSCSIPRKRLKELIKRKDGPALRDTAIWFAALITSGILAYLSWGTWWAIPAFALYGTLYASPADSRWHECGHGTAFRTPWMNDVVYQIAAFMVMRQPTPWRWSHTRHHTDTIIVGRDPEINAPRPPDIRAILLNIFNLQFGIRELGRVVWHAFGRLTEEEKDYIPPSEVKKVYLVARIWLSIYVSVVVWSIAIGSILPLMFIGLPSFYGAWLHLVFNLTQHAGLAEDVLDHRLNTRTVYLNPVFRFIYWNMNYHLEHHMFPMAPYHSLPALHDEIKKDTPPPYSGLWETYKEIVPTLRKQLKDPSYYVVRALPPSAQTFAAEAPREAAE